MTVPLRKWRWSTGLADTTVAAGRVFVVGLTGTGLVADDLCLLAHHDVSGKPFLQPRALGLGLAGALLAELVLAAALRVGLAGWRWPAGPGA